MAEIQVLVELSDLKMVFPLVLIFICWLSQFILQSDAFSESFDGGLGLSNAEIAGSDVLESKDEDSAVFAIALFLQSFETFPHHECFGEFLQTPIENGDIEIGLL